MNYFDDPNNKHFSFESFAMGLAEDTFGVINFKGYEAISETYDFEIMLVSSKKDIDLEDVLQAQAVFTIHRAADDNVLYSGILAEFDQLHEVNDVVFYRARLVPKLWWLTLTHHNQVFLKQSVTSFVEDALRDGGLDTADFDIGALTGYEDIDYTCQYDESHFNFVSRWLERQGIYYYFTQETDGEVLVLTDTKFSHEALKQGAELFYNPASGLEGKHLGEAIGAFTCRQKQLPKEIILKDYNYERPSLDITSRADVDSNGRGISYIYGESFLTSEDGERLAHIRAEELLCQKQEFFGESTVPYIMPGFKFNLNNHYREDFNQEYLILEVTHEGNQSHLMSAGISTEAGKSKNQAIYRNTFKAIPNDVQYRPERVTDKPKISGTIHAHIDSEVDGEYAQIDEQGRYRVSLPFDINDEHMDGKGSAPIRMMQPYAGKNRGMQFPLAKGTEVLLTFIEGNPDRPVIAGAVSNPETQGPVTADNQTESVIQTGGNNKIRMEDNAGKQRVMVESPAANSWLRIGEPNDPVTLNGSATIYLEVGETYIEEFAFSTNAGLRGPDISPVISGPGGKTDVDTAVIGNYTLTYNDNTPGTTPGTAIRTVHIVDDAVRDLDPGPGIRIQSSGNLFLEADSRYAMYAKGTPSGASLPLKPAGGANNYTGDIYKKFTEVDNSLPTPSIPYSPTGMKDMAGTAITGTFKDHFLANTYNTLSSLDSVNTQEGNIYDFGGYWNYNLGNSYAEDHLNQSAVLNAATHRGDLLNQGGPGFTGWRDADIGINTTNPLSDHTISKDSNIPAHADSNNWTNIWVQKTFGDGYEYTDGNTISVTKGSSQEIEIGGVHVEESYRGDGSRKSYSIRGTSGPAIEKNWNSAGVLLNESSTTVTDASVTSSEKKYDRTSGGIVSTVNSIDTGSTTSSYTWTNIGKADASVYAGGVIESSTFLGGTISNSNYIGGKISMSNYVGIDISNSNYLGGKIDINLTAAMILDVKNLEVELTLTGMKNALHTNKIDTVGNNIKLLASGINNIGLKINSSTSDIEAIATVKLIA